MQVGNYPYGGVRSVDLARKWLRLWHDTTPTDREAAERAVAELYDACGRPRPRVHWYDSPAVFMKALRLGQVSDRYFPTRLVPLDQTWSINGTTGAEVRMTWSRESPQRMIVWESYYERIEFDREMFGMQRTSADIVPSYRRTDRSFMALINAHNHRLSAQRESPLSNFMRHWAGTWQRQMAEICPEDMTWEFSPLYFAGLEYVRADVSARGGLGEQIGWLLELAQQSRCWLLLDNEVYLCDKPVRQTRDERQRLHAEGGPAIAYAGGRDKEWWWHGVRVPRQVSEEPHRVTVAQVDAEPNAEVRRVMLERMGMERYLDEGGAREIQRDECGILYWKGVAFDEPSFGAWGVPEPTQWVRVRNATPEGQYHATGRLVPLRTPDGAEVRVGGEAVLVPEREFIPQLAADGKPVYKEYVLRVPPSVKTAREAVAWTFGEDPERYRPRHES